MSKKEAKMRPINYVRIARHLDGLAPGEGLDGGEKKRADAIEALASIVVARAEGKTGFADRVDVVLAGLLKDAG